MSQAQTLPRYCKMPTFSFIISAVLDLLAYILSPSGAWVLMELDFPFCCGSLLCSLNI